MTCLIVGPGLVGSFLGAAAGAACAVAGPSGAVRAHTIEIAGRRRSWRPHLVPLSSADDTTPVLVATSIPATPWRQIPATALAAQNGLGQPRPLLTCFFGLDLGSDGIVRASGPPPRMVMETPELRWLPVITAWRDSGIAVEVVGDARPAQWEKAILNATVGPLCLATGLGMGAVWADRALRLLVLRATDEGQAIAQAQGVRCATGLTDRAEHFFGLVGDHRPSLLRHPGELPWILGHLLSQAKCASIAIPALARIARLVADAAALPVRDAETARLAVVTD